jgi:membrane protein implicated in regulation of membrane protease activity
MADPESIYLLVFIVSLGFTLASFAMGVVGVHIPGIEQGHHDGFHPHLGHGDGHGHLDLHGHDLHGHAAPPGAHAALTHGGGNGLAAHHEAGDGVSPFNLSTILAFLTWFGGAGYLLTAYFGVGALLALLIASFVGLIGASIVFFFLVRILLRGQTPFLRDEDYQLEGTLGRLSVGIRGGRTGEVVFSKAGSRRVASARSEDGEDIPQGTEVVVTHREGGVAYVRRFEELLAEEPQVIARN